MICPQWPQAAKLSKGVKENHPCEYQTFVTANKGFDDEMPFLSYIWEATNLWQTDQKLLTNPCAISATF